MELEFSKLLLDCIVIEVQATLVTEQNQTHPEQGCSTERAEALAIEEWQTMVINIHHPFPKQEVQAKVLCGGEEDQAQCKNPMFVSFSLDRPAKQGSDRDRKTQRVQTVNCRNMEAGTVPINLHQRYQFEFNSVGHKLSNHSVLHAGLCCALKL